MQIICSKRLHFQDHEIIDNLITGEKMAILKQQFVVSPSVRPQEVPDWIKSDDLFNFSVEDGTITVVQVLSTSKTKGKLLAEPKSASPTSGWGAKPDSGLPNGNTINKEPNRLKGC